ncbi:MAG TPA: magnesium transporter CorA family protein [Caulobacteraceae bacterium]|nr:magnesium transporter CorA family protein [Caulobacteraceae bacterium]
MLTWQPPGDQPSAETVWIDLLSPTEAELRQIEAHTGYRLPTLEDLSAIERSSQLIVEGQQLRLSCPVIADADTDHPSVSHVGMILTPKLLVTVRFTALKAFEATIARVCPPGHPADAVEILTALLEAFVDRQADLLEKAREQLVEISHGVFRASPQQLRKVSRSNEQLRALLRRLGGIGERISIIRDGMLGVGRIAGFAQENAKAWITPEFLTRLHAVGLDIDSLNLFEEHLSNKVQFLLDAIVGFIGIEQNDIFKVLTVFSVVGIFPTLVAGWYGMNFHNMPEYGWAYGYQFGIGAIVLSTIIPLAWFKWRGWL